MAGHEVISRNNSADPEVLYPNGDTTLQTKPGKQFTNGPAGTYQGPVPIISDPERPAPTITYTNAEPDGEQPNGTTLVTHHDTGTTDVITAGKTPVTVDNENGQPVHLGTTDHPIQGPIAPQQRMPEGHKAVPNATWVGQFGTLAGVAGDAVKEEMEPSGKHGKESTGWPVDSDKMKTVGSALRIAGNTSDSFAILHGFYQGAQEPEHAGEHILAPVGGAAGGYLGSRGAGVVGRFGGPLTPITQPAAMVLGGMIGSIKGEELMREVGRKLDEQRSNSR